MDRPNAKSGNVEALRIEGGVWRWRHRTWQKVILFVTCMILTATNLPQVLADLHAETETLLSIKKAWGNPKFLSTWSSQLNTCSDWGYVHCNEENTTIIYILLVGTVNVLSPLPMSIGTLVNLEFLEVTNCGLTGQVPSTLGLLRNLTGLNLSQNNLNGSIPSEIGNLTKLQSLGLANNNLTGPIPESIAKLQNLTFLSLASNHISGPLPDWMGDFPLLESLFLGSNEFTGTIPASLGNLTNLYQMDMTSAWISSAGSLPVELGKLTSLTAMALSLNTFEGSIPTSFGNLISLVSLDLSSCSLGGAIPSSLGNLSNLQQMALTSNSFSGPIPHELGNALSLITLHLDQNQLHETIPPQLSQLVNLTYLNLHSNFLSGSIPTQLTLLSNLMTLDLSSNSLSGEIPKKLVTLPDLTTLSLQDNCLTGPIPPYNTSKVLTDPNFGETGNSNCFNASQVCKCAGAPAPRASLTPVVTPGGDSGSSTAEGVYIGLGVGLGSLLAILGLLFLFCWRHNRHLPKISNPNSLYKGPVLQYTFRQVEEATNNFTTKVGEGAYSTVYKAEFENGIIAGVKRFNKRASVESFQKEVELLSSLQHRCLVNLIGYCEEFDAGERMLLYEFMDGGNLSWNLHGQDGHSPLTWEERVRVAISVAYGIDYLHFGTEPPMFHRDIKSANILLSSRTGSTLIAKVADFGLGRQTEVDADVMTTTFGSEQPKALPTTVAGTPGYFDPEYVNTGVVSYKTDVFSYGVVLLELLTGRRAVLEDRSTLSSWARPYFLNEDIMSIIDPELERETVDGGQLSAMADLARRCTETHSENRPTIKEVLSVLTEVFKVESRMVNSSLINSSVDFSESNSTIDSQSRVLPQVIASEDSMNYTHSEIQPRD